jgi:hypothetical protein
VQKLNKGSKIIMANSDVVNLIASTATDFFTYMLPIIAFMTGIIFITSFLMYATVGVVRKTFK